MTYGISFSVEGTPISKQSFIYDGNGHGHTDPAVKAWQEVVAWECAEAMRLANYEMITEHVDMDILFILPDKRKKDLDNLSKAVLDSCNGILYKDDSQVHKLTLSKTYTGIPGAYIAARPLTYV
jgi:Holliday junction resolvase RusA-like endonuclease